MDFLQGYLDSYWALFLLCLSSGVVYPLPEDFPLMFAGMRLHEGHGAWLPTIALAWVAVMIRDCFFYAIGRTLGTRLLAAPRVVRFLGAARLAKARQLVERMESKAVLAGRFSVGMRALIFVVAGSMGVSFRAFLIWDGLGLLVTIPFALWVGFQFGAPVVHGVMEVVPYLRLWGVVLALVCALGVAIWVRGRRRESRASE